jgi:rSAM/selenodomain-associated transferase 2
MQNRPLISVIIPAVNEAASLSVAAQNARSETVAHEIIVAAAPSEDGTASIAEKEGCFVVACPQAHRARQMNLGAAHARGEVLLFLHADTILPAGALDNISCALANLRIVGGAFARRYDSRSCFLRFTCILAELRSRTVGLFLGDQAIFVRREVFGTLGGFREIEIFEDLDFSQRMRRAGATMTLRPQVISSGRRFEARGPFMTTCCDFLMTCQYAFGTDPRVIGAGFCNKSVARVRSEFMPEQRQQR